MVGIPTAIPKIVQRLFPRRLWEFPAEKNKIYLTFDDGPVPQVTPWVLQTLKKYNAKATFFCIGNNIEKHPTIFSEIIRQGHSVGNHTQHHSNGWKTSFKTYINEINTCQQTIQNQLSKINNQQSTIKNLYRPPFGKITAKQAQWALDNDYEIVMWNILTKDYDSNISAEKSVHNILKQLKTGSIVVFHDSLKAEKKLRILLPKVLDYCKEKGWECEAILV